MFISISFVCKQLFKMICNVLENYNVPVAFTCKYNSPCYKKSSGLILMEGVCCQYESRYVKTNGVYLLV